MASLKKKKRRKAIFRRQKELAKIELDKAWRRIFVKAGVLRGDA
ncbi:DUF3983 domain-containing protein [Bacillus sp. B15-48]|nr:DUF3983 domain-containing protein [Bacillus sp. B15-48]MBM4762732.1 DUF3983 domain-containing protein [Bacillus sp. B15-48]